MFGGTCIKNNSIMQIELDCVEAKLLASGLVCTGFASQ